MPRPDPESTAAPGIAAVFVSFNCDDDLLHNVVEMLKQVDVAVVVDNGSAAASDPTLRAVEALARVTLIRLGSNTGIAKALNVGIQAVVDRGCEWAVTMDQDSRPGENLVQGLLKDLGRVRGPVAIVAPLMIDATDGTIMQGWAPLPELQGQPCPIEVCMTSGALTNTRIWAQAGRFNESYFIDYVDHEFCLRCHDVGALVLQSFDAAIYHKLGRRERHAVGRWKYFATHHSALRRYFITRNRLHLWSAFWRGHHKYIRKDMKAMLVETLKILAVEDHKLAKLGSMARGIAHAVTGRPDLNRK